MATDQSNSAVADVEIKLQHVISGTARTIDESFIAETLRTGADGTDGTEIRVADAVHWYNDHQTFILTPAKCSGTWVGNDFDTRKCDGVLHEFEPPTATTTLQHLFDGSVSFTDTTAVAINGFVMFGETLDRFAPGNFNEDDWVLSSCPTLFDGMCYCPISGTNFDVVEEGAKSRPATSDDSGAFSDSAGYGNEVTLHFTGLNGHEFEFWNVTGGTFGSPISDLTIELIDFGTRPNVTFTATKDSYFVLVNSPASMRARVLGGDKGVKFITGQRVLAEKNTCGFSKQLVVTKGEVEHTGLLATDLDVSIPDDSSLPTCSSTSEKGEACRIPIPRITSNSSRLPCEVSKYDFMDQYFGGVGASQPLDLGTKKETNSSGQSIPQVTFTYVAPLCFEAIAVAPPSDDRVLHSLESGCTRIDRSWPPIWANPDDNPSYVFLEEALLTSAPQVDEDFTDTEFGKADDIDERAIFCEDDNFNITFALVEVYPSDAPGLVCDWPADYDSGACSTVFDPETDFKVAQKVQLPDVTHVLSTPISGSFEVSVLLHDGISGDNGADTLTYNGGEFWGFNHTINPTDPSPFTPFTNVLEAYFERPDYRGSNGIYISRRAVTLGVLPEDVPQVFTMTTKPTMIFATLRDPPGGGSSATLHEGSTINIDMSVEGMHAADISSGDGYNAKIGQDVKFTSTIAPLGVGVNKDLFQYTWSTGTSFSKTTPSVAVSRSSSQEFSMEFSFEMDISTSDDPFTAGQPSDLILGGGMNLQIMRSGK